MSSSKFQARHYEAVASVLREQYWSTDVGPEADKVLDVAASLGSMFQADNPRFNPDRFMDAVKGDDRR